MTAPRAHEISGVYSTTTGGYRADCACGWQILDVDREITRVVADAHLASAATYHDPDPPTTYLVLDGNAFALAVDGYSEYLLVGVVNADGTVDVSSWGPLEESSFPDETNDALDQIFRAMRNLPSTVPAP